jgi:hypothetical protein
VQLLPVLPRLSALQQLRKLHLGGWAYRRFLWPRAVVGVPEMLQAVQGAAQLQQVTMAVELAPGSSKDQLVLGLQGALPRLVRLEVPCHDDCPWGSSYGDEASSRPPLAPATLAALRPGLKVMRAPS